MTRLSRYSLGDLQLNADSLSKLSREEFFEAWLSLTKLNNLLNEIARKFEVEAVRRIQK